MIKKSDKIEISIIIPVYNQGEALNVVLQSFNKQENVHTKFEIIIVDDGSKPPIEESFIDRLNLRFPINYIWQQNAGRAEARNVGVNKALGEILIFCDADRIPERNFVSKHYDMCMRNRNSINFGNAQDYFGREDFSVFDDASYIQLEKYSRKSIYYNKIKNLFDEYGYSTSLITWCAFLVGNSSMHKDKFLEIGGFDNSFREWGFEHYDFALRAMKKNLKIRNCDYISNYHIPHKRIENFYRDMIRESIKILIDNHGVKVNLLEDFLFGRISLQSFDELYSGKLSDELKKIDKQIFYKFLEKE